MVCVFFTLLKHIPSASLLPCSLWRLVHLTALSAPLHTYQVTSYCIILCLVMSYYVILYYDILYYDILCYVLSQFLFFCYVTRDTFRKKRRTDRQGIKLTDVFMISHSSRSRTHVWNVMYINSTQWKYMHNDSLKLSHGWSWPSPVIQLLLP